MLLFPQNSQRKDIKIYSNLLAHHYKVKSDENYFGIKCFKPRGRVSLFFFTVAFLLFLTTAGGSNPAGQSLTVN